MEVAGLLQNILGMSSLYCDCIISLEKVLPSAVAQSPWKGFSLV